MEYTKTILPAWKILQNRQRICHKIVLTKKWWLKGSNQRNKRLNLKSQMDTTK